MTASQRIVASSLFVLLGAVAVALLLALPEGRPTNDLHGASSIARPASSSNATRAVSLEEREARRPPPVAEATPAAGDAPGGALSEGRRLLGAPDASTPGTPVNAQGPIPLPRLVHQWSHLRAASPDLAARLLPTMQFRLSTDGTRYLLGVPVYALVECRSDEWRVYNGECAIYMKAAVPGVRWEEFLRSFSPDGPCRFGSGRGTKPRFALHYSQPEWGVKHRALRERPGRYEVKAQAVMVYTAPNPRADVENENEMDPAVNERRIERTQTLVIESNTLHIEIIEPASAEDRAALGDILADESLFEREKESWPDLAKFDRLIEKHGRSAYAPWLILERALLDPHGGKAEAFHMEYRYGEEFLPSEADYALLCRVPVDFPRFELMDKVLFLLGAHCVRAKRLPEAEHHFRQLETAFPSSPWTEKARQVRAGKTKPWLRDPEHDDDPSVATKDLRTPAPR